MIKNICLKKINFKKFETTLKLQKMSLRLKNRPEINGLRALAVLSVVIYHAKINHNGFDFISGGFVGVDIFFVISGYLISSLIFKEIKKNNKLNIYNFYLRRSRRILPALFFVVSVSYIFFSPILIYTPLTEFSDLSRILNYIFFKYLLLSNQYSLWRPRRLV